MAYEGSAAVPACQQTLHPPPLMSHYTCRSSFPLDPAIFFPPCALPTSPPGPAFPWSTLQHSFFLLQNSVVFLRTRHLSRLPQRAQSCVMSADLSSPWTAKSRLSGSPQCWPQW